MSTMHRSLTVQLAVALSVNQIAHIWPDGTRKALIQYLVRILELRIPLKTCYETVSS